MNTLFRTEVFAPDANAPQDAPHFVSITKGLSETNAMPNHGRNVHRDDLKTSCDYHGFDETLVKIGRARFAHNPYAALVTMRFRNLAFERLPHVATDIQCILFVLFGTDPVVMSVRPMAKGTPFVEADVMCHSVERLVSGMAEKVVVIDRHGFHVARGTVSTRSVRARRGGRNAPMGRDDVQPNSDETAAALNYCKAVRQMPQKERHFKTDGLPCVPVRIELPPMDCPEY